MMEIIWPTPQGTTVFATNPKMEAKLQKDLIKRNINPNDLEGDEDFIDGDMDAEIDRIIQKIFEVYDKKKTNMLPKKVVSQFFSDLVELHCLRQGRKKKDVVPKEVNQKKALEDCILKMNPSQTGNVTLQEFTEFLNCYDMSEAIGPFLGTQPEFDIQINNIQWVDTRVFENQKREGPKLVYREYPDD